MTATLLVEALNSTITLVAAALPNVSVTYDGVRAENTSADGDVWGVDPLTATGAPGPMKAGRKHPREEGTLTLACECLGDSQLLADRAVVALAAQVETVVADNPNLGLGAIESATVTGKTFDSRGFDRESARAASRLLLTITYKTTLR